MKNYKFIIMLSVLLAVMGVGTASAQNNWISGQIGLLGAGVGYERVLTPSISVGGEVYYNSLFFFWNSFAVEANAKFYPFKGVFYAKLGLGFGTITGTEDVDAGGYTYSWVYSTSGFLVDPGIGWKIDVGSPGGFFIEPKIGIPIVLGKKDYSTSGFTYAGNGEFKVGVNFVVAFGMGYAF
ncbi:hypothetical protein [Leadbettera azotonutricia]|uniref:Outer membrane protein beta-barrel domain-containing protein n=1 Tax=Leadbettera azotonutricia (strain ATCC BAA-888 / DSM 13862 / ZAS-9) TaxID=545695 RepID=F5YBR1_LEAAZ|nr:hypothetical protein [Leadbettera azotonutricia]AEF82244.1 hypothetical protein TREAZ_2959 [Leadbettera azotonutricia ZAS-9]